ncbi:uncharacterized protein [Paramormyrops kingsleyae]|uniref:uncharacterized protein isoform X1 n=2 Tax=Paramormyrops kingsleyae TaxID=1676925 RepID=UPI003B9700BA
MSRCDVFQNQIASIIEVLVRAAVSEMRKVMGEVSSKLALASLAAGATGKESQLLAAPRESEINAAELLPVMERLAKEAVKKICCLVNEDSAVLRLEVTQSQNENEALKRKLYLMEEELKAVQRCVDGQPGKQEGLVSSPCLRAELGAQLKRSEGENCFSTISEGRETASSNLERRNASSFMMDESAAVELDGMESVIIKDEIFEEDFGNTTLHKGQRINGSGPEDFNSDPTELLLEPQECAQNGENPRKYTEQQSAQCIREELIENPELKDGNKFGEYSKKVNNVTASRKCSKGERLLKRTRYAKRHSQKIQQSAPSVDKPFSCTQCDKAFAVMRSLKIHQAVHKGQKALKYTCLNCGKGFRKKMLHEEHQKLCTSERNGSGHSNPSSEEVMPKSVNSFVCTGCGKSFSQIHSLKAHQVVHSVEKPFSCTYCGKGFAVKHSLTVHQRIHTGEKPYSCVTCGKTFSQASHRKMHSRVHTGEKPFTCDICGKSFGDTRGLKEHQVVHTGEKAYKCEKCGKCFSLAVNLRRHHRIHTGEKPYSCDICGKCFSQASNVKAHKRIHSDQKSYTGEKSYYEDKPYSCSKCEKSFSHPNGLKTHQLTHTGEKPFSCTVCEKSFRCLYSLKTHQRFHTGEKPYSCVKCGKCFGQTSALLSHQRVHTGEKPFSCDTCGKCFSFTSSFKAHQRSHTGEKPFSCVICGKNFSFLSNLKRHKRIHTGEKPFSCHICEKSFSQANNLKAHQQIHTGEKPYMCDKCGKSFAYLRNLKEHKCVYG